ncbi:hypothetical protein IAG41_08375 [Sphingomonas sp. JC676]|uniref:hypothetical protein n=1 Tax=Sphingomonas sp. JC676 TaxID=2768065 RepID=UPI0016586674|nr:hypothetical protein [Sphingomonas sp. JC676]MBC9032403.1 hypothetical protein [Sphingomonas sp. JC676]
MKIIAAARAVAELPSRSAPQARERNPCIVPLLVDLPGRLMPALILIVIGTYAAIILACKIYIFIK